jgi:NADP-dependent 3-hydroxy acid dehydrogenase YdfG
MNGILSDKPIARKEMHNTRQICLITGATAGIGKAAAIILAAQGLEMVLTGRNVVKLQNVVDQIRAQRGLFQYAP